MTNSNSVCVPCRKVVRSWSFIAGRCPECGEEMVSKSPKWRAPKKIDDRAWKRIEAGDWLWDNNAIERAATRKRHFRESRRQITAADRHKWQTRAIQFGRKSKRDHQV